MADRIRNLDKMASPAMKELAESIVSTGEAIKQFQEQYLAAVRAETSSDIEKAPSGSTTNSAPSPARHAELIQGIMDNMEQIKHLAGAASTRHALPVRPEAMGDLGVRGAPLLLALSDISQARIVAAARAKLAEADGLIRDVEHVEKLSYRETFEELRHVDLDKKAATTAMRDQRGPVRGFIDRRIFDADARRDTVSWKKISS
ncbi:hypothetical protein BIW11_08924 [Tropilaelaps mercedesae]|uniref:Uncharacterized protein n=1 Tax=Tropilaelaps mercedesae TaxID=418985 RepID=A0A1V9XMR9_9ACAR|nr:hypothetical protein BIW11_08924 [Tropilaelaps mercedesae]